jgi:ABC-type nitrate/sulfonate/bicarbonate transport system ATPase subunit
MIQVENLTYSYQPGKEVFQDFNWRVDSGDAWVILGPSGCGKTTLLYLLAGLQAVRTGKILVNEQTLTRPRPQTGLVLQDYGLLPWATVRQNIELGLRVRRFYGPDGKHAPVEIHPSTSVDTWLERLGLAGIQHQYPTQISGGQRQRTAIARTLVLQPDMLLMDEPFASLDAPTREDLQNLTLELWNEQALTLIIVTHTIEEAVILGKKILLLNQPPNRQAIIIDNPGMQEPDFRESRVYSEQCRNIRRQLEDM